MPAATNVVHGGRARVATITTRMALIVAALITLAGPLTYFELQLQYYQGALAADADNAAFRLSKLVTAHPLTWRFRIDLLEEALERFVGQQNGDELQIKLTNGVETVIEKTPAGGPITPAWLAASAVRPVFDSGRQVGDVELSVSLRAAALQTLAIMVAAVLLSVIAFTILRQVPLRALDRALEEVAYLARHDPLTDLPNRTLFHHRLAAALGEAARQDGNVAILCLDLDRFKDINDTLGHAAGDHLLRLVADRVRAQIRCSDTLARLGGDEFAIVQIGVDQPEGAAYLAQRIVDTLSMPFDLDGHEATIGCSVGIALYPDDHREPEELLRSADLALYGTKAEGRGIYRFFEPEMNRQLQERKLLEAALRRAVAEDQFEVHYQPQVDLASRRLCGAEALVRWNDPERGIVSPGAFVPLAEQTGLILPITEWVLRRACQDARGWAGLSLAVNLSPVAFRHPDLLGLIRTVLNETGFAPERLELEITETSLLQDTERTVDVLRRLKAEGVRVAMDDFGTGYSSLSYLQRFPFDKIKIDRAFVSAIAVNEEAAAIVRAVVGMGHSLGMRTVAEGVETDQQVAFLAGEGCDEVQGFYYARPMPAGELSSMLRGIAEAEPRLIPFGRRRATS